MSDIDVMITYVPVFVQQWRGWHWASVIYAALN